MKRFLFPLLISCSVLVLLSGCSGEGTDDGSLPPKPPKPPEPKKRKMLVKLPQAKKVYKQGDSIFVNLVKQDDSLVFDSVVFSIGSKELCVTSASGEINVPVPEGNFGTQKLAVTVFAKGKVVYETKSPSIELRSDVKPQYWAMKWSIPILMTPAPIHKGCFSMGMCFTKVPE